MQIKHSLFSLFLLSAYVGWGQSEKYSIKTVDTLLNKFGDSTFYTYHIYGIKTDGVIFESYPGFKFQFYTPNENDIIKVENKLPTVLKDFDVMSKKNNYGLGLTEFKNHLQDYKRQYYGIVYHGKKFVCIQFIDRNDTSILDGSWLREWKFQDYRSEHVIWSLFVSVDFLEINGYVENGEVYQGPYPY